MMHCVNSLPTNQYFKSEKDPDEIIPVGIDFADALEPGELIEAALFDSELAGNGNIDLNMIVGTADISKAPLVLQVIQGGADGSTYLIRAKVTTSLGYIRVGSALLQVSRGGAA